MNFKLFSFFSPITHIFIKLNLPFSSSALFATNHRTCREKEMSTCNCQAGPPVGPTLASVCGGGPFMLFMGLLEVFIRSQCDLDDPCRRPQANKRLQQSYVLSKPLLTDLHLIAVASLSGYWVRLYCCGWRNSRSCGSLTFVRSGAMESAVGRSR